MPEPIRIRMGGYGPPTTGFSRALKRIGDRLAAKFGDRIEVKYVWNIMDLGYRAEDILWLVEHGLLTLGYQSSSYLTDRVPELGIVDLPFLFADTQSARAAMDGGLGDVLARKIEERVNFRVLGWFENGFRHISNRMREVRTPADLAGMRIRGRAHARRTQRLRGGGRAPHQGGARDVRGHAIRLDGLTGAA
jgi:TRAP-type transport system periplasmic protein